MFYETNDGARIHYVESGAGKPLVLIGGWTITTSWWKKQIDSFSNKYRVIAIDPRAYGRSEKVVYGHRLARHAVDIFDLLTVLDLNDVTLAGWSLGANVLFAYWEIFRNTRISRFVHIDQTPFCLNNDDWQLGLQGFGNNEVALKFCEAIRCNRDHQLNTIIDNCYAIPPSPIDKKWMREEMLKTPPAAAAAIVWDHLNTDWRDIVPTITIPVMVASGLKSKMFPWQSGVWLREHFPNAQHILFKQSGHCPFLEEPNEFNNALEKFISRT